MEFIDRYAFQHWAVQLVESVRWVLIVGNLTAIVIGTILDLFPDALAALEARDDRWYSDRRLVKGADAMNLSLDNRVAAPPRARAGSSLSPAWSWWTISESCCSGSAKDTFAPTNAGST